MRRILPFILLLISAEVTAQKKYEVDAYGYIADSAFHKLIKHRRYDFVDGFRYMSRDTSMKYAFVMRNNRRGYIDQCGREVVRPVYRKLYEYKGYGLRWGKWRKLDAPFYQDQLNPKYEVVVNSYSRKLVHRGRRYFVMDRDGKKVDRKKYHDVNRFDYYYKAKYISFRVKNKWGLMDSACRELIPPIYDHLVKSYIEDVFFAQQKGKWGVVKSSGEIILPLVNDSFMQFNKRGFYLFTQKGKVFIMDSAGHSALPPFYDMIYPHDYYSSYSAEGKPAGKVIFYLVKLNSKTGLLDENFREITPPKYDQIESFSHGMARVKLNNKYGFINVNGKEICPAVFDLHYDNGLWIKDDSNYNARMSAYHLLYDRVRVSMSDGKGNIGLNGKCGWMNLSGNIVIPPVYDCLFAWGSLVKVSKGNTQALLDSQGHVIIKPTTININFLHSHKIVVVHLNSELSELRDSSGKLICELYCSVVSNMEGIPGMLKIRSYGKVGLIDLKGRSVIPAFYSDIVISNNRREYDFTSKYEIIRSRLILYDGHKRGLADTAGHIMVPVQYNDISYIGKGYYTAVSGSKWGILDSSGRALVPFVYDRIYGMQNGMYLIESDGKKGLLNSALKLLCPLRFNEISAFRNGYAIASSNEGKTVLNSCGRVICEPKGEIKFEDYFEKSGLFIVEKRLGRKFFKGLMDTNGNTITPLIYNSIKSSMKYGREVPYYMVSADGKKGVIDRNGTIIFDIKFREFWYRGPNQSRGKVHWRTFDYDRYGNRRWIRGYNWHPKY